MKITLLRHGLDFTIDEANKQEIFKDSDSGWECRWNASQVTDAEGHPPHTGWIVNPGDPAKLNLSYSNVVLDFEKQFLQFKAGHLNKLSSDELDDVNKSTHTTGGSRRSYITMALRWALDPDPANSKIGVDALMAWNMTQLKRPFSHIPFVGVLNQMILNNKQPEQWDADKQLPLPDNYNAFDVAHLESGPQFALAALNHPLGLVNMFMLWRWFIQCLPPGTTFWYNQERSVMWTWLLATRAHYCGFGGADQDVLDDWCRSWKPAKALWQYVTQYVKAKPGALIPGDIDDRVMTDLKQKDWNGYGPQVWAAYSWQNSMAVWGACYVLYSHILDSHPVQQFGLVKWAQSRMDAIMDHASGGIAGISYAFGLTELPDQATAQQLLDDVNTFDANRGKIQNPAYEIHQLKNGKWIIRVGPRVLAAEEDDLTVAPLAWLRGKDDSEFKTLWSSIPDPSSKYYVSKFDDAVFALLEK